MARQIASHYHDECTPWSGALQGFRPEQLVGMGKSGVLRATGSAMPTPVVAAAFKRCVEVLVARLGTDVPRIIPQRDKEGERRRIAMRFLRAHIALLEAQEAVLRRTSSQGRRASGALARESHRFRGSQAPVSGLPRAREGHLQADPWHP